MTEKKREETPRESERNADEILTESKAKLAFLAAIFGGYKWKDLPLDEREAWGANRIIEGVIKDLTILEGRL